jgi:hypothetical protein
MKLQPNFLYSYLSTATRDLISCVPARSDHSQNDEFIAATLILNVRSPRDQKRQEFLGNELEQTATRVHDSTKKVHQESTRTEKFQWQEDSPHKPQVEQQDPECLPTRILPQPIWGTIHRQLISTSQGMKIMIGSSKQILPRLINGVKGRLRLTKWIEHLNALVYILDVYGHIFQFLLVIYC